MSELVKKDENVRVFRPSIDVAEKEDGFVVWADVPGVKKGGVDVNLDGDVVTVRARVEVPEHDVLPLIYREYHTGDYELSFRLTTGINRDKIKAEMKDGVLTITLPKAEAAKPRSIKVKAA